jgi:hypothetical protein
LSRNTIRKYLRAGTVEPKFKVSERPSKLDPFAEKLSRRPPARSCALPFALKAAAFRQFYDRWTRFSAFARQGASVHRISGAPACFRVDS